MLMKIYSDHNTINTRRWVIVLSLLVCHLSCGFAQIKIGGNVYGGGNEGDTGGSTSVTVRAGDFNGAVFGGARQANVGGSAFVNIDGEHISGDITINYVYGGNDISGNVGEKVTANDDLPVALTTPPTGKTQAHVVEYGLTTNTGGDAGKNTQAYNAFILTTPERSVTTSGEGDATTTSTYQIFIGQMFGGGNGAYDYTSEPYKGMQLPEVKRTYQELRGGTFGYVYAGGNNATVTDKADICIDNSSTITTATDALVVKDYTKPENISGGVGSAVDQRLMSMGLNLSTFNNDHQFLRVFGGNNKADMHIRPTWHLQQGDIENLYSGGNEGRMTATEGILLEINPQGKDEEKMKLKVENVFGGCRRADVCPTTDVDGKTPVTSVANLSGYRFPPNLAARVLVRGGDITNVYGGNDISGKVYFGNALGVYTSIKGDIYGGGNGSYAYTDNPDLKDDLIWGDFYYDKGDDSAKALNANRPNAEQVSIRVAGEADAKGTMKRQVIIGGSIYVGGNSATLKPDPVHASLPNYPMAELKIGSYVIADKVFLGNNGEEMISRDVLEQYVGTVTGANATATTSDKHDFSSLDLTDEAVFAEYMNGCAMDMMPQVVFDDSTRTSNPDPATYIDYSSYFGSFFCGGNVGSMTKDGKEIIDFSHPVIIFDKLVGGCNNAFVYPVAKVGGGYLNAAYNGGLTGDPDDSGVKLQLDLEGLKIQPKRWKDETDKTQGLEWNTYVDDTENVIADNAGIGVASDDDKNRRFRGGNVYGGCYESGHVNGDVVININGTIIDREGEHGVFDTVTEDAEGEGILYDDTQFHITERRSGVILDQQGMDVLGSALSVFGGGYGKDSEIWGSTTVNLNKGYVFQIFGGGEMGAIGKGTRNETTHKLNDSSYSYNAAYSTTINLHGEVAGVSKGVTLTDAQEAMLAEAEFIYGGGFEGLISGDTHIYLGNGRVFNTFAGSCNADILGHTETYVGKGKNANGTVVAGFPWVRDHVYGGNDLGGRIRGSASFSGKLSDFAQGKSYSSAVAAPTTASAYMEYTQGRVDRIFGGCYGDYDYITATDNPFNNDKYSFETYQGSETHTYGIKYFKPYLNNAFVNIIPTSNANNAISMVFGAGQGISGDRDGDDMQDRSYVLIDIPQTQEKFKGLEVFGAGAYDGLGMRFDPANDSEKVTTANSDKATAIVDLVRGQIAAAYGGSYNEGITRRTMVNVPAGSTIRLGSIFGGAYGNNTFKPCDVYESHVEYHSADAWLICNPLRLDDDGNTIGDRRMKGAIYGGNNNERRTIYAKINVDVKVNQDHWKNGATTGNIYGAGCGANTWAEYTEVNLNSGAEVYEVYGGGEAGKVFNTLSVEKYMQKYKDTPPDGVVVDGDWATVWPAAWTFGRYYTPNAAFDNYRANDLTSLNNTDLVTRAAFDDRTTKTYPYRYNTNVLIRRGALVNNYAYGGGLGADAKICGSTYIALLGGTVKKDLYAAGTSGAVQDWLDDQRFTASANAYVAGGTVRNVYGGGWEGSVGHHEGAIENDPSGDSLGETHVVIGIRRDQPDNQLIDDLTYAKGSKATVDDYGLYYGVPAIQRNAYGGGEGGAVFGTTSITLNNGYIGYVYSDSEPEDKTIPYVNIYDGYYQEKLHDETWTDHVGENRLEGSGNLFGGGYVDNSSVDFTNVTMYGGLVRNSLFGGGEIAAVGRGKVKAGGYQNSERNYIGTTKHGKTTVTMYKGHVQRDVFGGGKGYDNLGKVGTLYTDGYVFGQTEVRIRGGEVGTATNYADGYGNVFGGGDIGYVYGLGTADEAGEKPSPDHYYYIGYRCKAAYGTYKAGDVIAKQDYDKFGDGDKSKWEKVWTEDVKVVVEPYAQVTDAGGVTIDGTAYPQYSYVPTDVLNKLKGKNDVSDGATWNNLDDSGVIIHNAVFAGGNIAVGSDKVYANAVTVFGNVTASLRDIYRRDLITIGTEHIGGLYGGGNLSLVNGYREMHISNYGTDYYGLSQEVTYDYYQNQLTDRERAYFRLRYTCLTAFQGGKDAQGITYKGHQVGDQIYEDEFNDLPDAYKSVQGEGVSDAYWKLDGVCSIYAGRLLNTLQRADLVGVYGSRLVLQGARDRVTDVVDYTRYTINRVGELSLKKVDSPAGETDDTNMSHGNYFGIYSVVNYLGNMTSDVLFDDVRTSDTSDTDDHTTYYDWKKSNPNSRKRNTATCHNQVALASGVFLELTKETSTAERKDYGYITGVVELDLINAKADEIGGGYVYAKNEHGTRSTVDYTMVTLSEFNNDLRTYKMYTYNEEPDHLQLIQTSGNFIHDSRKIIIDDCYPHNMSYDHTKAPYSEAHYWYIKGSIYIYDQVISAYTGSPTAYTREKQIPLTITAGSHGQLKLVNVQPNLYAYYENFDTRTKIGEDGVKVNNNSVTYKLNDIITYWDWSQLPEKERELFVEETYVSTSAYKLSAGDTEEHPAGEVMLPDDYKTLKNSHPTLYDIANEKMVDADDIIHPSNNISHKTGYVVSFEMDTPPDWNTWYSKKTGDIDKISTTAYKNLTDTEQDGYRPGPTFKLTADGSQVFGQRHYDEGEIIPQSVHDAYSPGTGDQATVSRAYVTAEQVSYTYNSQSKTVNAGTAISETEYNGLDTATKAKFKEAKMCISTLKLSDETYILYGELLNEDKIDELARAFSASESTADIAAMKAEIEACLSDAYICEEGGLYGGHSYDGGTNYDALEGWAALTAEDRNSNKFTFNFDALDVLADPDYRGDMNYYRAPYNEVKNVEYTAIYNGDEPLTPSVSIDGVASSITQGTELTRPQYEQLANEKYHYTPIRVTTTAEDGDDYYIAKQAFSRGNMAYAEGQVISSGTYRALSATERADWVTVLKFTNTSSDDKMYFYCREDYTGVTSVTNLESGGTVSDGTVNGSGTTVGKGWVISQADYTTLKNEQKDFIIKGEEPTESTTLYVSRESDIRDLSKEKIISVIYQYTYNEGSDDGDNVELVNEMHIINIHLQFESGAPIIDQLLPPELVLPGTIVGMNQPNVTPGAYELIGGGWEIFDNETDAKHNRNGQTYRNNETPMYWYQNNYWVAYYAKSYLGKTYSNPVQFSVANYHDLAKVMGDKEHHYYIDHKDASKERNPKIYINDYSTLDDEDPMKNANGLDLLKQLYDLSLLTTEAATGELEGHALLNERVKGGENLDFILRTNIDHSSPWTPIGSTQCFGGTLHGDGYTISGLDHSLFDKLCGAVYNLGVTGSFSEAGIANSGEGYMENCWISTTGTPDGSLRAVFGNPTATSGIKVVNCYYPEGKNYLTTDNGRGLAKPMSARAFYDGTVAYDLNGFYLWKRYNDHSTPAGTPTAYNYYVDDTDTGGNAILTLRTDGKYGEDVSLCSSGFDGFRYVEDRYGDGDFIYQEGTIPEEDNIRLYTPVGSSDPIAAGYYPIWPDDYLFFGQSLNYGQVTGRTHQGRPSRIAKGGDRLTTDVTGNRVYRAPAYFRNYNMATVHFNPYAVFVEKNVDGTVEVHKNMTAIDFTGYNDTSYPYDKGWKQWSKTSQMLQTSGKSSDAYAFYPPLLDDGGLSEMRNIGLTQNLLAYTDATGKTADAVATALPDEAYAELDTGEKPAKYRAVAYQDPSSVKGHHVSLSGSDYVATNDHFLVDKQDFNAPIAYTFADGYRMWYQRYPDTYVAISWTDDDSNESTPPVRTTTGWEGISLPFNAEVVTTHQKGEITHFYNKSWESKNDKPAKIGHEYWLREFADGGTSEGSVYKANMVFPTTVPTGDELPEKKEFESTFLWDYYYSYNRYDDANTDDYQEDDRDHVYYKEGRIYEDYAYLTAAKPYIIGFPGATYREFDLSGNFTPANTLNWPVSRKLAKQYVTFASATGTAIGVSDLATGISADGYIFKPSYLNEAFAAGTANTYTLNAEGSSYDVPAEGEAVSVAAFRPYFVKAAGGNARTRSIIFGDAEQSQLGGDGEHSDADQTGTLIIRPDKSAIVVTSALSYTTDVRIFSTAGVTLRSFTIQPGETVESRVLNSGVYIVRTLDGQYTKKLSVK